MKVSNIIIQLYIILIQGIGEFLPISSSTFLSFVTLEGKELLHMASGIGGLVYYFRYIITFGKKDQKLFGIFSILFGLLGLLVVFTHIHNLIDKQTWILPNFICAFLLLYRLLRKNNNYTLNEYYAIILSFIPFITMFLKTSRLDGLLQFFLFFFPLHQAYDHSVITTTIVNLSGSYFIKKLTFTFFISQFVPISIISYFVIKYIRQYLKIFLISSIIIRIIILFILIIKSYLFPL